MENLNIEATKYTPEIKSDIASRTLSLTGKSYPENTFEFYEPVIAWIEGLIEGNKDKELTFNFEILYYNSSSSKAFFDIFDILEEAVENGSKITVNWQYDEENETMQEAGEDFAEDFESLTFNVVQK